MSQCLLLVRTPPAVLVGKVGDCLSNRLLDLFHTNRNVQLQQLYSEMAVPVFRSGLTMLNNPASGGTGGTGGTSSTKKFVSQKEQE